METKLFVHRRIKNVNCLDEAWLRYGERNDEKSGLLTLYAIAESTIFPRRNFLIQSNHTDSWGIQLFIEGEGQIRVNNLQPRPLGRGDCILLLPNVQKKFRIKNTGSTPLKSVYLLLERDWQIERFFEILAIPEKLLVHLTDADKTESLMYDLMKQVKNPDLPDDVLEDISCRIFSIMTYASRNEASLAGRKEPLSHLLLNVSHSPHNYPNIRALMNAFDVSRGKLYRLFMDRFGMAPMDYIIRKRLSNSLWLLLYTDMSVVEIALQSGYRSQSFYSKSFKKVFGISPSQFRSTPIPDKGKPDFPEQVMQVLKDSLEKKKKKI